MTPGAYHYYPNHDDEIYIAVVNEYGTVHFFTTKGFSATKTTLLLEVARLNGRFVRLRIPEWEHRYVNAQLGRKPHGNQLPPVFINGHRTIQPYYERLGDDGYGQWRSHQSSDALVRNGAERGGGKPAVEHGDELPGDTADTANGHHRHIGPDADDDQPVAGSDNNGYGALYKWHRNRRLRERRLADG